MLDDGWRVEIVLTRPDRHGFRGARVPATGHEVLALSPHPSAQRSGSPAGSTAPTSRGDAGWSSRSRGGRLLAVACSDGGGSDQAQTTTTAPGHDRAGTTTATADAATTPKKIDTIPGMPGVPDPSNLYSETATGKMSDAVKGALTASTCRTAGRTPCR